MSLSHFLFRNFNRREPSFLWNSISILMKFENKSATLTTKKVLFYSNWKTKWFQAYVLLRNFEASIRNVIAKNSDDLRRTLIQYLWKQQLLISCEKGSNLLWDKRLLALFIAVRRHSATYLVGEKVVLCLSLFEQKKYLC